MMVLTPAPSVAQSRCTDAFTDTAVLREVEGFEKVAAVAGVWGEYTLARHPLLLVADSSYRGTAERPVCAAVWRQGRPLEVVPLHRRPRMSTPLYGMINLEVGDTTGPNAGLGAGIRPLHPGDSTVLAGVGVTRAVVLRVPLRFEVLGALGQALAQAKVDPVRIQSEMAAHESFHLHVQVPAWLNLPSPRYPWPPWDVQPDRMETRSRCYASTPQVTAALESERRALLDAYDAVLRSAAADTVASLAGQFVDRRLERYALLDTATVASGEDRMACAAAERMLELEEGLTQWVGHKTLVRAGLTRPDILRQTYAGSQPDVFYLTGPLQLWIMGSLLGDEELLRVLESLARAGSPTGVFESFQAALHR